MTKNPRVVISPGLCYHCDMVHRSCILVCVFLLLLAACAPAPPEPTVGPVPTLLPSPTPVPSATPTTTPIPSLTLTLLWPDRVSALQPVPVEVELVPPPGISATATIRAVVIDSTGASYQIFDLRPREGNLYAADESLQLPLEPFEGEWRLVVDVWSELGVEGARELSFRPAPIRFRDLTSVLPAGVDMRVPQDFVEVTAQGDSTAGGRVWHYEGGEIALWWAPGPSEPLLLNNAIVMLETTYGVEVPAVSTGEETVWQDQTAFLFHEDWPEAGGGTGEAWVIQGPDHWLYVLRLRAVGEGGIPTVMHEVWETFAFGEE